MAATEITGETLLARGVIRTRGEIIDDLKRKEEAINNPKPEPETNVTPGNSNPEVTEGSGEDANPFFGVIQGAATDPNKDASDIDQCEESKASEERLESDFGGNSEIDTILSGGDVSTGSAECNPSTGEDSEGSSEDCVNPNNVPTTTDNAVGGDDGEDKVGTDYGDEKAAAEAAKNAKDSIRVSEIEAIKKEIGLSKYNSLTAGGLTQDEIRLIYDTSGVSGVEELVLRADAIYYRESGTRNYRGYEERCSSLNEQILKKNPSSNLVCSNTGKLRTDLLNNVGFPFRATKTWEESLKAAAAEKYSKRLESYIGRPPRGGNSTAFNQLKKAGVGEERSIADDFGYYGR